MVFGVCVLAAALLLRIAQGTHPHIDPNLALEVFHELVQLVPPVELDVKARVENRVAAVDRFGLRESDT
jgi:hypothetical protein